MFFESSMLSHMKFYIKLLSSMLFELQNRRKYFSDLILKLPSFRLFFNPQVLSGSKQKWKLWLKTASSQRDTWQHADEVYGLHQPQVLNKD